MIRKIAVLALAVAVIFAAVLFFDSAGEIEFEEYIPVPLSVYVILCDYENAGAPLNSVRPREIGGEEFLFLPYWAREAAADGANIMHGSRIPTIFISTESGCLEFIHADRNNRERVEFLFVDENGFLFHEGAGDMNGRGNYTWLQPKRPYNFRLERGVYLPLFGLGEGRHWTLLANYMDETRVRNIVALNLARELGISHTSRIRPVDVFINGDYAGVFDLVERRSLNHAVNLFDLEAATFAANGLNLSGFPRGGVHAPEPGTVKYVDIPFNPEDISGGYLLEMQFPRRYMRQYSGFVTARGAPVNLRAPELASRAQMEYISGFFQALEDAVYSETGYNAAGVHFSRYLDMQSFALMYVFSEFIMDVDAANSSFFMYKDAGGEKIFAGPPWDFDFTLGALAAAFGEDFRDPTLWWVNRGYIDMNPENGPHLLAALYSHEIFREYALRIWREEAAPAIRVLVGLDEPTDDLRSINAYIQEIAASREMERIIWPLPTGRHFSYQSPYLQDFARARFLFLDSFWGE